MIAFDSQPMRVTVNPSLLKWARERAALDQAELARKMGLKTDRVAEWEATGELEMKHLERLAAKTHVPTGYLFLPEPPIERLPIADFRRVDAERPAQPSPDLLDTLRACQLRQAWYRDFQLADGEGPLAFVESVTLDDRADVVATRIRRLLGLDEHPNSSFPTWEMALRNLYEQVERIGILVMRNGVVGNNTHRRLDVAEFRGFTLSDRFAPLIFVNAADAKSAQMFTIVHELCHVLLGESGVSDADPDTTIPSERFCNEVAANTLVPLDEILALWSVRNDPMGEAHRLVRHFKVSLLVMLIRARDAGLVDREAFNDLYAREYAAANSMSGGGGGDFYRTQGSRLGSRFASAVIASALEGRTPYSDAFRLLGVRKAVTFEELARKYGMMF